MKPVQLDLSFLSVPLGSAPLPTAPVNVYDILRDGWRETRVDMTLRFFLDPNERHGLGPLVIDALLNLLDGSPTIGPNGTGTAVLDAEEYVGSDTWEISTQDQYIDVYATNRESGIAIVIENKIGHVLNNPLDTYASHALNDGSFDTVLVAVLAPERRQPSTAQALWLSKSITYAELSDEIKRSPTLVNHLLNPTDRDQIRSLDLLQQFMEVRSGGTNMKDLEAEAARVNEWRDLEKEHRDAIRTFLDARSSVMRVLSDRRRRLEPLIAAGLEDAGLKVGWENHSGSSPGLEVWNAYHFPAPDWSVELKFSADPKTPDIFVYDYQGRTYRQATIEGLGLQWTASDDEIADTFVERTKMILEEAAGGQRQGDHPSA